MKRSPLFASLTAAMLLWGFADAHGQSAFFSFTGVPNPTPGSSFTVGLNITFTSGGNINNLAGFSYWFWQSGGPGSPIAITNRSVAGSIFTDLQSPGLQYPQQLTPINRNPDGTTNQTDLGALFGSAGSAQPSGTYFVANLTFSIAPGAQFDRYTISTTTQSTPGVAGRFSVITDNDGDTFAIAPASFSFGPIIPEPSTTALLGTGALLGIGAASRKLRRN
jgi:hypothetical protein